MIPQIKDEYEVQEVEEPKNQIDNPNSLNINLKNNAVLFFNFIEFILKYMRRKHFSI
mgnify:CR=1 FL=1